MNNTPTPETDAVRHCDYPTILETCRKLERERDEARARKDSAQCSADARKERIDELQAERDQLRKVCDELAKQYRHEMMSMFGHASDCDCSRCEPMIKLYNILPHVIAKKGNL